MIKAIVFDMDGLMFDTERLTVKALDYAGEQLGVGKLGYIAYRTLGMTKDAARKVLIEDYGDIIENENLSLYAKEFFNDYYNKNGTPLKPGLINLLNYLKENKYKIALATSSHKDVVFNHFKRVDIKDYFDVIVSGDMIVNSKPHPDIYLKASDLLRVPPIECLALEDSIHGIYSANAAKFRTILIPDLIEPTEEILKIANYKLQTLNDVIQLLKAKSDL